MSSMTKFVYLIVLLGSVFAEESGLAPPCNAEDTNCVKKSLRSFLAYTADGIPKYDVKPLDPLVIPLIEHTIKNQNVKYTFRNMTVLGMKNISMIDYNIDSEAKTVLIRTKANLNFHSDFTVEYISIAKSFSGDYSGAGKAIVTVSYPYGIITDEKGEKHFDVGAEKIECEAEEATANIDRVLMDQMLNDPKVAELRSSISSKEDREKALKVGLCNLVKTVYTTKVHNIRAAARVLPKEAFFKNI